MLSFILIAIAAFFNAVMDTLETGHFTTSIFKKLNPKFWAKDVSWQYAKHILSYPVDAWHIAKSLMIFAIAGAIVVYKPVFPLPFENYLSIGIIWIVIFDIFYVYLLKSK